MGKPSQYWVVAAALACGLASGPAAAIDALALQGGLGAGASSGNSTEMARVALQWEWQRRWFEGKDWHIGGFWEGDAGYWQRDASPGENGDLYEIGFTPVFRLQQNSLKGAYLQGGVGLEYLSSTSLGNKRYGSHLQFASQIGVGYRFEANQGFDVGLIYQHVSNAGLKQPNEGANFYELSLQYHF